MTACIVLSYNHVMSQSCKAAWSGGRCERPAGAARGLCQGHYAQWRRQTDSGKRDVRVTYEALRQPNGEGPGTVPVTVHLPPDAAQAYKRAAGEAGQGVSELLRPWLEAGFKRHQARAERRTKPPPS